MGTWVRALALIVTAMSLPLLSGASSAHADEGSPQVASRMMLVLDSSGSMKEPTGGGQTKIAAARSALKSVIAGLPEDAEAGLRVFGATVFSKRDVGSCDDTQLVVSPGTDNRAELQTAVGGYQPYGETPIPAALRAAAKDLGAQELDAQDLGARGARSIVLVSDGESTCAPDPCHVAAQLAQHGIALQINVVGLSVSGPARDQLRCIAENGNGTYVDADSAHEIAARLDALTQRALRPFTLTGAPIAGGTATDPTPITTGDFVDSLGGGGATKSYVFTRTAPGTTLRATALSQDEPGDTNPAVLVKVTGPDGAPCDSTIDQRTFDTRTVLGAEAVAGGTHCSAPGAYTITVSRGRLASHAVPIGLRISEEPPITSPGVPPSGDVTNPEPLPVVRPVQHVVGGGGFATAAPIAAGSYSGDIVPGETQILAFPLEYGQSARVSVAFAAAAPAIADAVDGTMPTGRITLYSPMLGALARPGVANDVGIVGVDSSGRPHASTYTAGTTAVSAQQHAASGAPTDVAGTYYLAISMGKQDYSYPFPLTVTLAIDGSPAQGPTYDGDVTWSDAGDAAAAPAPSTSAGASTDASTGATSEQAASEAGTEAGERTGDTDGLSAPVWMGLGVLVLAAVAGGYAWMRRRGSGR